MMDGIDIAVLNEATTVGGIQVNIEKNRRKKNKKQRRKKLFYM